MAHRNSDLDAETRQAGEDEEQGLDWEHARELAGYFARAPRRRPKLAIATFAFVLAFAFATAAFWPRSYHCEVRLLAQKNLVLPALGNPGRAVPRDADNPTKNVADTILQRDNIVALVKGVDLLDRWGASRQPLLKLKDKIYLQLFGPVPEEDQLRGFVGSLEKKLTITTDESSIDVALDWPDAQMAFEIVSLVQKNFLEARYDSGVNVIIEAIRILEERAKEDAKEVDAALAEMTKLEAQRRQAPPSPVPAQVVPRSASRTPGPLPAGDAPPEKPAVNADDTKQLEDVRRQIRSIEDDHRRRLSEAQSQLAEARTTLGPMHPTVLALNVRIQQLTAPPPELLALKADERALVGRIAAGELGVAPPTASSSSTPSPRFQVALPSRAAGPNEDDAATGLARARLQSASAKYSELLSRIDAAEMELDVTRAAFKYQYTIVYPAELPLKPKSPVVSLIVLAGSIAAVLLALLLAGGIDLARGRFVEPWQVRRKLKLPVLGELAPPPS